ncbi:MAG TPA: MBL fold metallo-hydrolase [Patescibacteria group bacterium]|nr:MBL fold metallo-hydrolase [Patescibacteria group bacterium]
MAKLIFLGAAGTVTGSKHLVEAGGKRLLVDCGLFQGEREVRQRNWETLPVDPASIDWVILTHAHIDHTGYLPRLVSGGFRGPILANAATRELCGLLLRDSAHLQEEDALYAAKKGYSRHKPPLPLYTVEDAENTLALFQEIPRKGPYRISPEFSVRLYDAGHILGSSIIEVEITENGKSTVVVFTGDLGRYNQPILKDPEPVRRADYLVCESTYGDREHPADTRNEQLADAVNRAVKRRGVIVVPAFAVGRTQTLLYILRQLEVEERIPRLPTYLDSPMAISVTDLYEKHHEDHSLVFRKEEQQGDPLNCHEVHMTRAVEESKKINAVKSPCIILSASGMATGGRVVHHLLRRLPDRRNLVMLVGYQAQGTPGRALLDGVRSLRLHGEEVAVRAEVVDLPQFSAHADCQEVERWLGNFEAAPKHVFLVHGEPAGANALRKTLEEKFHWPVSVAEYRQEIDLV